jgi:hypothetical protein
MRYILEMLVIEHTDNEIVSNICSFERDNASVVAFYNDSLINSWFSVICLKKVRCPKKHLSRILYPTMGLVLNGPRDGETLEEIIADHFRQKISVIECNKCKRHNPDENGMEKITVVKFPKYLLLFIDGLDDNGLLKHPVKGISS